MKLKKTYNLLLLPALFILGCQSGKDEEKTIASTHPKLEEQLAEDSLEIPSESGKDTALYSRYRITQQEYESNSNYQVTESYSGIMPPLDEASHKDVSSFKSALQAGLKEGINFAGKYTVVSIGCGTSCQTHYVVDRQSGKIMDKIQSSLGASFKPDSRLFLINPPDSAINYNECANCKPETFVFENGKFNKLSSSQ